MKIYDNGWFLRHGLEPEQAADMLAGMGVTFVLAQSKLLPMQDTAIESEVPPDEAKRFATLDDRAFRDALKERGIAYFASLNFGFDPELIAAHPEAAADRPIRPEGGEDRLVYRPAAGPAGEHHPQARHSGAGRKGARA